MEAFGCQAEWTRLYPVISHSQGNGTTPPGTIPGIQADAFGFLDVWELLLVFSSLGTQMPAACHEQSSPEPERAAPRPAGLFFFFCSSRILFFTYAKHRLEKVVRQVNVLAKFGDNYLSVGSLGLAVSMFLPVMFLQSLISSLIGN